MAPTKKKKKALKKVIAKKTVAKKPVAKSPATKPSFSFQPLNDRILISQEKAAEKNRRRNHYPGNCGG